MSVFSIGALSVPAFSGKDADVNRRAAMCSRSTGPIPSGQYHIFDRQSGGKLGPLWDILSGSDKSEWFSLYAIDEKIDDYVICNHIKRGNFRLHPKGRYGISEGCITIEHMSDFQNIRAILKDRPQVAVAGTSLKGYGRVTVR
ncbi:DUF2778 domain-containing protein [Collimonas silvisoli]|uniref:DUF2778 domain-containing protein n=1 Tax=Collimonas silvisoli TaxID=2825884 RepID=UPI001E43277A|nr:DUF2778 domain-containing protein [Collimonas silvisoli]